METVIQRGIPAPQEARNDYSVLRRLGPGDSVVFTDCNPAGLRATIGYYQRRYNIRLTMRTQPDGSRRVWRVS
jgi:hypothetical protein